MKNNLLWFVITFLSISCDKLDENEYVECFSTDTFQTEQAFPNITKEIYETNSGLVFEKLDDLFIMQGDIIFTPEQIHAIEENPNTRGGIFVGTNCFWPNCRVYYDFASDFSYKQEALRAMDSISSRTGVRFGTKVSSHGNYIHFLHGDGNYSSYGMTGGAQNLSISTGQSDVTGIIMHELCHALGLFHEQSRADRDMYITINWNNILEGKEHNFKTYAQLGLIGSDVGSFNLNSIMMYSPFSFAKIVNGL